MVQLFYTTYISVDLAHHNIFGVKVGKGGIKYCSMRRSVKTTCTCVHSLLVSQHYNDTTSDQRWQRGGSV